MSEKSHKEGQVPTGRKKATVVLIFKTAAKGKHGITDPYPLKEFHRA
jgi:hypothetical protein